MCTLCIGKAVFYIGNCFFTPQQTGFPRKNVNLSSMHNSTLYRGNLLNADILRIHRNLQKTRRTRNQSIKDTALKDEFRRILPDRSHSRQFSGFFFVVFMCGKALLETPTSDPKMIPGIYLAPRLQRSMSSRRRAVCSPQKAFFLYRKRGYDMGVGAPRLTETPLSRLSLLLCSRGKQARQSRGHGLNCPRL